MSYLKPFFGSPEGEGADLFTVGLLFDEKFPAFRQKYFYPAN